MFAFGGASVLVEESSVLVDVSSLLDDEEDDDDGLPVLRLPVLRLLAVLARSGRRVLPGRRELRRLVALPAAGRGPAAGRAELLRRLLLRRLPPALLSGLLTRRIVAARGRVRRLR